MAKVRNAIEILQKISTGRVGRTSVADDRQTDDRRRSGDSIIIANVNTFTFAKNIGWSAM